MIIQDEPLDELVKYKIFWGVKQIESFEMPHKSSFTYKVGDSIEKFRQKFHIEKIIKLRIRNTLHIHIFTKTIEPS